MVKDVDPSTLWRTPWDFPTVANGVLFFVANDGIHGVELWKSDGTSAGTVLVKDIRPGSGSAFGHLDHGRDAQIEPVDTRTERIPGHDGGEARVDVADVQREPARSRMAGDSEPGPVQPLPPGVELVVGGGGFGSGDEVVGGVDRRVEVVATRVVDDHQMSDFMSKIQWIDDAQD
jgi:ELWxxDGT repeat protein